jgi:hypothetical protein
MSQKFITYTPDAVVEAVEKIVDYFGEENTKEFYAADGEAIVEYRESDGDGNGLIRVVAAEKDHWVACAHIPPGHSEPGLPDRFNTTFMFNTNNDWWDDPGIASERETRAARGEVGWEITAREPEIADVAEATGFTADHPAIVAAMARKEAKRGGGAGEAQLSEPVVSPAAVDQITPQLVLHQMPMGHYVAYDTIVRQVATPSNINEVRAKVKTILSGLVDEGRLTLTYGRGYLKREPGGA